MRNRPRTVAILFGSLVVVVAGSLAFCAPGTATLMPSASVFHDQAVRVAQAWETSTAATTARQGLTLLSATTWMPYTEPPPTLDISTFQAILGHYFIVEGPLPSAPATGTVTFAIGGALSVPLETAEQAYREFASPCPASAPQCPVLGITGAELTTRHLMTGRGEADVPVWRFLLAGIDQPIDQVAVAPSARRPVPQSPALPDSPRWNETASDVGALALTSVAGTAVEFMVAPTCFTSLGPLVYEDSHVVVLGARYTPARGLCSADWTAFPLQATLAAPIGDRVVLDVDTGHPVWQLPATTNPMRLVPPLPPSPPGPSPTTGASGHTH